MTRLRNIRPIETALLACLECRKVQRPGFHRQYNNNPVRLPQNEFVATLPPVASFICYRPTVAAALDKRHAERHFDEDEIKIRHNHVPL